MMREKIDDRKISRRARKKNFLEAEILRKNAFPKREIWLMD